jgi:hypothetical protein
MYAVLADSMAYSGKSIVSDRSIKKMYASIVIKNRSGIKSAFKFPYFSAIRRDDRIVGRADEGECFVKAEFSLEFKKQSQKFPDQSKQKHRYYSCDGKIHQRAVIYVYHDRP